jgi:hypothetical protein
MEPPSVKPWRVLAGIAVVSCACASAAKPSQPSNHLYPASTRDSGTSTSLSSQEPTPDLDGGPAPSPAASPPRTCEMFAKPGVLKRTALARLLDAGLARWLQGVEGDRALANHRFSGWLVKSLYPGDPCYQELDLRAGDVVQKVNGKSIEKPEQAFDVAESLRTAPALVVDYLRAGQARRLSIAIADDR